MRATAVSFCNGGARVITSFGPLVAGLLAAPFGGNFNKPAALMTCFALLSISAMYLGRETRADPLPRGPKRAPPGSRRGLLGAEPMVRIHLSPAGSLRTFGPSRVGAMHRRFVYLPA